MVTETYRSGEFGRYCTEITENYSMRGRSITVTFTRRWANRTKSWTRCYKTLTEARKASRDFVKGKRTR